MEKKIKVWGYDQTVKSLKSPAEKNKLHLVDKREWQKALVRKAMTKAMFQEDLPFFTT